MKTDDETRYPWAYGYLRSAVNGALELLRCFEPLEAERRLKEAVEQIDEELAR